MTPLPNEALRIRPTTRDLSRPKWSFEDVTAGAAYTGLLSALGNSMLVGPMGVDGLWLHVPDARLSIDIAITLSELPAHLEGTFCVAGDARPFSFPDPCRTLLLPNAMVISSLDDIPIGPLVSVDVATDLVAVLDGRCLVGWVLHHPSRYLEQLRGQQEDPRVQLAMLELHLLRDDNAYDALVERPRGFAEMVEHALAHVSELSDKASQLEALASPLIGRR